LIARRWPARRTGLKVTGLALDALLSEGFLTLAGAIGRSPQIAGSKGRTPQFVLARRLGEPRRDGRPDVIVACLRLRDQVIELRRAESAATIQRKARPPLGCSPSLAGGGRVHPHVMARGHPAPEKAKTAWGGGPARVVAIRVPSPQAGLLPNSSGGLGLY